MIDVAAIEYEIKIAQLALGRAQSALKDSNWIEEDGRRYKLHPSRNCPRCGARLMFGDPARGIWHCSAIPKNAPDWMDHFAVSRLSEAQV